jgi:hypothetical protein
MSKEPLFIEKNAEGKFAIKRANTQRASAICDTQSDAIERAKKMSDGPIHVERVRNTKIGSPDKWRRI